jgi:ribosome-associated toxin RatA of RatAB toxin-antitoxin module
MSKGRAIRAFDYVNQPYEQVRDAVKRDALAIFQRATKIAEERSEDVVASLSVNLAGLEIHKDITIRVGQIEETESGHSKLSRVTHVELEWQAADTPGLFPAMKGELAIYPLSFTETQVELKGHYEPPMGVLGSAVDALVGHRLAEASVHRFVRAVVDRLRTETADGT